MGFRKKRREMGEEAWAAYQAQRKLNNVNNWRKINVDRVVASRRRKKEKLVAYKGGCCEKCGLKSDICDIYDFHHTDPSTKSFGLASLGKNMSYEKCRKEVDKCLLVCKNCHAMIHYELRKQY